MPRRGLIISLLALCVAVPAVMLLTRADGPVATVCAAIATSEKVAQHCKVHDAATLAALRKGDKRVAVEVKSFQPATPAAAAIVVTLLTANKTKRQEVARFGIHPPKAFSAQATPHRFLVSLAEHGSLIEEGQPLCLEVGFATSSGAAVGGAADIDIAVVNVPGTPDSPNRK